MALALPDRIGLARFVDPYVVPSASIRDDERYSEHPAAWLDASWTDAETTRFSPWRPLRNLCGAR